MSSPMVVPSQSQRLIPMADEYNAYEKIGRLIRQHVDEDTNLLWEIRELPSGGMFTRAVCRPESCSDGHVCGVLDIGVVQIDPQHDAFDC